jgi:hypothetical protein
MRKLNFEKKRKKKIESQASRWEQNCFPQQLWKQQQPFRGRLV